MERFWILAAAGGLVAAFAFFWFQNFDGVFVSAVLGSVFWLLHYRAQTRRRVTPKDSENEDDS